jgi:hypothetical protein
VQDDVDVVLDRRSPKRVPLGRPVGNVPSPCGHVDRDDATTVAPKAIVEHGACERFERETCFERP